MLTAPERKCQSLASTFAARQIGEEAARVVVVARIDAELRIDGRVHEVGVPQVAIEEGEGGEALLVGEHG